MTNTINANNIKTLEFDALIIGCLLYTSDAADE